MGHHNDDKIDHDRLFKELIHTFFEEFMLLFFPSIYEEIDSFYISPAFLKNIASPFYLLPYLVMTKTELNLIIFQ
ncbi:hypothetical protein EV207_1681 [Scopulibacillus darangshiensis]|uniref:Uncharacterized protein n=1 Tax=Scopulibacillus darangshiensis TaxID=442528 RepID=A0A4R2NCV3_9BACL|nr:hypothetical protein EV207_1681 [Scopulibacillus darangshiensis]